MKKRTIGILAGMIALVALLFFIWPRDTQTEIPEVETTQVAEQDFQDVISTVGVIEPSETFDAASFTSQSPVSEVPVEVEDEVEEDQVLIRFLDGTQIMAPFSGTVVELNVEEGDLLAGPQQNEPALVLTSLDDLEVRVELSKNEADRVTVDQEVELTYLENTYDGTITHIDAVASSDGGSSALPVGQSTPTLTATIAFNEENTEALIPGFDIDADIVTETTAGSLAIPIEAILYDDNNNPYVFVVEDGVARQREITTGIQQGVTIEVTNGLELGEEVIRLPEEELEDGTAVTVVTDTSEDSNE